MIKISYEQLSNANFQMAFQKLMNRPMKDISAFNIMHIGKTLQGHLDNIRESFKKSITEEYAVPGVSPGEEARKNGVPFEPRDLNASLEAIKRFGKTEIVVNFMPISAKTLFACGEWTPTEIQFLAPVLQPLYPIEGEVEGTQQELPFPQK